MEYTHISGVDMDLGGGMSALEAWVNGSPIALVAASSKDGPVRSRLDLQKRIFIDSLPAVPLSESVDRLVVRLMDTQEATSEPTPARFDVTSVRSRRAV